MEGRAKVTKDVLTEEARFILANVMAEARYGRQNRVEDIRRVCEGAVSIPFAEYVAFLEKSGYLRHDHTSETLEVTAEGEDVVNGGNLTDFTDRAVSHFKKLRQQRQPGSGSAPHPMPTAPLPGVAPGTPPPQPTSSASGSNSGLTAPPLPPAGRKDPTPTMRTSGGQSSASVRGEIQNSAEIVDSRYEKLAAIGSGGIGTVYRARQVPLMREVALKEIRDLFGFFTEEQRHEIVRRFTEVVRGCASLAHPNILPIHDVHLDREL